MRALPLERVAIYFASKGRFMDYKEYKAQTDTPVSAAILKRTAGGSWNRVKSRIERYFPELAVQMNKGVAEELPVEAEEVLTEEPVVKGKK